ncbi:hypothetical protein SAMN05880558_10519 [Aeromonas sp. RU39B]|uniref:hypothetical protein n=1 Tax=Aeromonas sp. RU39B TaxID=1907416 RepID=UPI0009573C62|nr:hypothetical protein [Aeromonas sp. RU39B]SIQ70541.1 hypothetical protein SAMN05880558_10519 [Aeromonas sp. RU39B]
MIHLSAIEASRLLGKHPQAKKSADQAKKSQQVDSLNNKVLAQLVGFPEPTTELVFHPKRRWRLDFAWPVQMVALEVHGGIHSGGRHTRGKGFVGDRAKMNEALLAGWVVIEVTPEQVSNGQMREWLNRAFSNHHQNLRT